MICRSGRPSRRAAPPARRRRGVPRRRWPVGSLGGDVARARRAGARLRERRVRVRDVVRTHRVPAARPRRAPCLAHRRDREGDASAKTADMLVRTLSEFGVEASVMGQISGPRVYPLRAAARARDEGLEGRRAEGRPELRARDHRDPHPRAHPGKQAVGVEVPNLSPKLVTLGDIFEISRRRRVLSVWLGKDISGNAVWTDLARMPHLLIAGTTGSGKSGCINTILTSTLLRSTPDEVRMISSTRSGSSSATTSRSRTS